MTSSSSYIHSAMNPLSLVLPPVSTHDADASSFHQQNPNNSVMDPFNYQAYNPPTADQSLIRMAFSGNANMMCSFPDQNINGFSSLVSSKKPVIKKDRHSKIYTAQGLRDRRVRLSIGIAREFFDLQDMLGFDKASKTLEWLLRTSKKAIEEVAKHRRKSFASATSSSECNQVLIEDDEEGTLIRSNSQKENEAKIANRVMNNAKDKKAKAREKAKERTRDKAYKTNAKGCPEISTSQSLNQTRSLSQFHEAEVRSMYNHGYKLSSSSFKVVARHRVEEAHEFPGQDLIEESRCLIRGELKSSPVSESTYQQNQENMSKDSSFSSNNYYFPDMETDSPIYFADSPFGAMANMNPSTGFGMNGKPW